jgi:hypothetical protein
VAENHARSSKPGITVSVTAPGRVGASRLDVHCAECGAQESRYVPRGTVSVAHQCGDGWRTASKETTAKEARAAG